jgi:hypothetical protein
MSKDVIKCGNQKCDWWSNNFSEHCKGTPYLIASVYTCFDFVKDTENEENEENEECKILKEQEEQEEQEEVNNSISTLDLE